LFTVPRRPTIRDGQLFYDPTQEHLTMLAQDWCASFSGGKDSTSMVTWVEWLRRAGWITVEHPKMVRSDTTVEESGLVSIAEELTALLERHGWECAVVHPEVHERLYPQILGRGLPPIHPGIRRMRWCTRSTKIDPMKRWKNLAEVRLSITGLRLGESDMRDGKLKKAGCAAGGECGIPDPGKDIKSPILHWKTCQVIDWLNGEVGKGVRQLMGDIFEVTHKLVAVYGILTAKTLFDEKEIISSSRFGCIGCPAIGSGPNAPAAAKRRNGNGSPLNELYDIWHEARKPENRLVLLKGKKICMGPIRMEVRKRLFDLVMDVQRRSGVVLVTPEDEAFIRKCWEDKVYPRGSSEADEATVAPTGPLFDGRF
jgi:3'-phosphoadenosine 5'-phosphosulfate sulfotransferase (PAPS reductase)/FAD synthetase